MHVSGGSDGKASMGASGLKWTWPYEVYSERFNGVKGGLRNRRQLSFQARLFDNNSTA